MQSWIYLSIAIISEVIATSCLKAAEGFTHFWPSVVVIVGYLLAFYLLSLTLKTIPVGIAYAVWSGIGIVLIALVGWLFLDQKLDMPAVIGLACIIIGVIVINVFSKTISH